MAILVKLQFLLIGLAGADLVNSGSIITKDRIQKDLLERYEDKVQKYLFGELLSLPVKPAWLDKERLLSFNGHQLVPKSIYRLFLQIKLMVTTKINPLYRELTVGESLLDLSLEIREKLWNVQQLKRGKRKVGGEIQPFDELWEPNEWLLFLYCGCGGLHTNCFSDVVIIPNDQGFEPVPLPLATSPAKRVHMTPVEEFCDFDNYLV
jgi:hypothetical protein